jgi:hypothetical protein
MVNFRYGHWNRNCIQNEFVKSHSRFTCNTNIRKYWSTQPPQSQWRHHSGVELNHSLRSLPKQELNRYLLLCYRRRQLQWRNYRYVCYRMGSACILRRSRAICKNHEDYMVAAVVVWYYVGWGLTGKWKNHLAIR